MKKEDDKIAYVLGKLVVYLFLIALIAIISVLTSAIVNHLILWGFPSYGC